jgi:Protein of unknown function (DUF2490)
VALHGAGLSSRYAVLPVVPRSQVDSLFYPALLAAAVVAWSSDAVLAQQTPDRQIWVQTLALGQLSENWRTHLEVQPRFMNGGSELGLTIVRGAVGRRIAPRATLFLGYAWVPRTLGSGVRDERRVWQQLSLVGPTLGGWSTSARLRLEQRTLDPWADVSHRLRMLARVQRGAAAPGRWGAYAYNELMLSLDDTSRGPGRGFDRNRISAGLSRRLSPVVSIDAGYLWEHAVFGTGRRDDHTAIAVANLAWPRR